MTPDIPPGERSAADIPWPVLDRYLAGEGTAAEREVVDAWVRAHPNGKLELERLRSVLARPQRYPEPSDLDRVWREVRLRRGAPSTAGASPLATQSRAWPRWAGVVNRFPLVRNVGPLLGAFVAGSCVAALGSVRLWARMHQTAQGVSVREYVTRPAERETVTLADGTRFTLAPASRLRVPVDYDAGHRVVTLEGEAYFAVAHSAVHPFTVHAGQAVATDVGTAFDVRAYPGSRVRIVVAEGIARVATRAAQAAVRAGQTADVDATGTLSPVTAIDVAPYVDWTTGRLEFRAAPLHDVAEAISRWYSLDVNVADSALALMPFSGTINDDAPDQALDAIALVMHAHVTRHARIVTFAY